MIMLYRVTGSVTAYVLAESEGDARNILNEALSKMNSDERAAVSMTSDKAEVSIDVPECWKNLVPLAPHNTLLPSERANAACGRWSVCLQGDIHREIQRLKSAEESHAALAEAARSEGSRLRNLLKESR